MQFSNPWLTLFQFKIFVMYACYLKIKNFIQVIDNKMTSGPKLLIFKYKKIVEMFIIYKQ